MLICRTKIKKQIVTEFTVPKDKKSGNVLIFCSGLPGTPWKDDSLEFWANRGFWCFFPRYRGSWESTGSLLQRSPEKDILDVIDGMNEKFKDYWTGKSFRVRPKSITVIGTSFGGPAAIISTLDDRVHKGIAVSPVVDWREEEKFDPLINLYKIIKYAYTGAYRIKKKNWDKLATGTFYNPVNYLDQLNPKKVMIYHAENDDIVKFEPVASFAEQLNCRFITFKKGGHLSSSLLMKEKHRRKVLKFIKSTN